MIREIEFRGKRIDNGEWTFGYFYCHKGLDKHYILPIDETSFYNGIPIVPRSFSNCAINKETLGQYTGLKDKNGTKIFEGDLLYYRNSNHDEEDGAMELIFEDGSFMISGDILIPLHEIHSWELEVVGNIYDNPELVNGE